MVFDRPAARVRNGAFIVSCLRSYREPHCIRVERSAAAGGSDRLKHFVLGDNGLPLRLNHPLAASRVATRPEDCGWPDHAGVRRRFHNLAVPVGRFEGPVHALIFGADWFANSYWTSRNVSG